MVEVGRGGGGAGRKVAVKMRAAKRSQRVSDGFSNTKSGLEA